MIIMATIDEAYKKFSNNPIYKTRWNLANDILYSMCNKYPKHDNADEIVAKIWLIGRSYAAAIERRKNAIGYKGDFYYDTVAPAMKKHGTDIDKKIQALNNAKTELEQLIALFDAHAYLTNIFKDLTNLEKRSLAAKYLHFHCKDKVYIYDSIASAGIKKFVKKPEKLKKNIDEVIANNQQYDAEYVDFVLRVIELKEYIKDKHSQTLTPRQIDTFLLHYNDLI